MKKIITQMRLFQILFCGICWLLLTDHSAMAQDCTYPNQTKICYRADVTPDGATVSVGSTLTKTWRVQNAGNSCTSPTSNCRAFNYSLSIKSLSFNGTPIARSSFSSYITSITDTIFTLNRMETKDISVRMVFAYAGRYDIAFDIRNTSGIVVYPLPLGSLSTWVNVTCVTPGAVGTSGGGSHCGSATITAFGGTGGTIYYQGNTTGGTSTAFPISSRVVTSSGTYYFRARSSSGCWGAEGSVGVTITAPPMTTTVTSATDCDRAVLTASNGSSGTMYFQGTTTDGRSEAVRTNTQTVYSTGTYFFRAKSGSCWGPEGSVYVSLPPLPAAVTVSGGGSYCSPITLNASNGGSGTIYYQGTVPDGRSTSMPTPSVTVTTSGTYYFRARSTTGCWGPEGYAIVYINPVPAATTVSGSGTFFGNTTITAYNGGSGTMYFQGTISGGTSTAMPGTSQVVTTSGTYFFRAFSGTCWGPEGRVTVNINPLPATVTVTGGGTICGGGAVLNASNGGDGTIYYQGAVSGGTSTLTPTTTAMVGTSGTYYFRARSILGCWGIQGSAIVNIGSVPAAVTVSGGGTFACGTAATISATNGNDGVIYYQGTASGGTSTAIPATSQTITTAGIYYFRALSSTGCWGPAGSATVVFTGTPTAVTASGSGTFCGNTTITASNGGSGTIYFQGTTSGGTSTATPTTSLVVTSSGTYYFRAHGGAGCWGPEGSVTVTINPLPTAVTVFGGGTYCGSTPLTASNGGSGTIFFQGTTPMGTNTALPTTYEVVSSTGNYYFRARTAAGCWGGEGSAAVTIHPNPAAITGATTVCITDTGMLNNTTTGGVWTSGNTAIATVDALSGRVSPVTTGSTAISYTLPTGCIATTMVAISSCTTSPLACGEKIYFSSPETTNPVSNIWVMDTNGTVMRTLFNDVYYRQSLAVSVDGTKLAYTKRKDPSGCSTGDSLWICTSDNDGSNEIIQYLLPAFATTEIRDLSFNNDNSKLTFNTFECNDRDGDIYTIDIISHALSRLTFNVDYPKERPNYSPDGTKIAYTELGTPWYAFPFNGRIMNSDGSGATDFLPVGVGGYGHLKYSPNGLKMLFVYETSVGAPYTLYTVNPDGSSPVSTGVVYSIDMQPVFSPASNEIAIVNPTNNLEVLNLSGSVLRTISRTTNTTFNKICWSRATLTSNTGSNRLCVGASTSLTNSSTGGVWRSNNTGIATVGSGTGVVSGIASGTAIISYTLPTGCRATTTVVVNPLPAAISSRGIICPGDTATYTNTTTGGAWSSSNTGIATIGSVSGIVTGIASGVATITYRLSTGCYTTAGVTIGSSLGGNIISTIAGNGTRGFSGDGGVATAAQIAFPQGIAVDGLGNVYIGDNGNTIIRKINSSGIISTIAGTGVVGTSGDGGPATLASMRSPYGIAVDGVGNIYFADGVSRIRKISTSGIITTVVGGSTLGYFGDGGTATAAQLYTPTDVAIDIAGNLFIADAGNQCVRKVNTSGIITTVAGIGTGGTMGSYSGDGGPATVAELNSPYSLALDLVGNIFIADRNNNRVRKVSLAGIITTIAGTGPGGFGGGGFSGDGGPATSAQLFFPNGIDVDGLGNVYVTDYNNWRVRVISSSGIISTFAGDGTPGYSGDGGSPTLAQLYHASVLAIDNSNGIFIADYANHAIRKVSPASSLAPINGTFSLCAGATTTLTDTSAGGIWSSNNTGIATVGSGSGIVTGVSAGTVVVTYAVSSCSNVIATLTVFPLPAAISGTTSVCESATTSLSNAIPSGTWSSSNTGVAIVGSGSGVVTGIAVGTALITYSLPCGFSVVTLTVNPLPVAAILSGPSYVNIGSSISLSSSISGGIWLASNGNATIVGGIVTGVSAGMDTISYMVTNSCGTALATKTVVVNPTLGSSSGATSVCVGLTTTLSNGTPGGVWTSGAPSVAAVDASTGVVTGITPGTARITYTVSSVFVTTTITVRPLPAAITGENTICAYLVVSMTNSTPGGIWTSSNNTVATIGSASGQLTAVMGGTTIITYTLITGCLQTKTVTISPITPILDSGLLCVGQTITLTNATPGGRWTSSNNTVATVGSNTGIVTGVRVSSTTINYFVNGCWVSKNITVSALTPIIGETYVCQGGTTTFSNASGGRWSSSNTLVATVGSTGVVSGVMAGTAIITCATPSGCIATKSITTVAIGAITGRDSACVGQTISLSNMGTGGIWTSGNTAIATIGSLTGVATGLRSGYVTITYTIGSCRATKGIYIGAVSAITGTTSMYVGQVVTLTSTGMGYWQSSDTGVATVVSNTGSVTAVGVGTAVISYTLAGCTVTTTVAVAPATTITFGSAACVGQYTSLTGSPAGGTWSCSNVLIATIGSSSGIVYGAGRDGGNVFITYTPPTGPATVRSLLINRLPLITGATSVCTGQTVVLNNTEARGVWTATGGATVSYTSGVVSGVSSGTAIISYSLPTGCTTTTTLTVHPLSPITGPGSVCTGDTIQLTNATPGGTWLVSDTRKARIDAATGEVIGILGATIAVSYTISTTGCRATSSLVINGTCRLANEAANETENLSALSLIPNPNNGQFRLRGNIATTDDAVLDVEVINILGQRVYKAKIAAIAGRVDAPIALDNNLAGGTYMLTIRNGDERGVFHFVVVR